MRLRLRSKVQKPLRLARVEWGGEVETGFQGGDRPPLAPDQGSECLSPLDRSASAADLVDLLWFVIRFA